MNLSRERLEQITACCLRAGIASVCLLVLASCQRNQPIRPAESPVPPQSVQQPSPNGSAKQVIDLAGLASYRYAVIASVGSLKAVSKANKALQSAGIASYTIGSRNTFKIQVREQDRERGIGVLKASSLADHYALVLPQ
ncbi:MAG TPA: hypothetical protein VFA07_13905 [Chthonomonadaceae bacterium]|nr:hypothetical protein [Chthonomonadaceae bacterium]